jgi:MerR family mercuric resistance operon transcriptional regulator
MAPIAASAAELAAHKLADVRARLADLRRIEATLTAVLEQCCSAKGEVRCPLIGSLQQT